MSIEHSAFSIQHLALIRLPARKTPLLEALIYRALTRPALRRTFHRIAVGGDEPGPSSLPTLLYANHPSWWDGYMAFFLSDERWRREAYLMMEEPQLARYSFFRYCGVFGVDRHDPREGMRSIIYAADLLGRRPGRLLWIFPQGEITPNDRRPLGLFRGAAHIAKRAAPVRCVPVALRFEFVMEQRPEALIRFGPAHTVKPDVDAKALHSEMEARLTAEVDHLRDDVIEGRTAQYVTALEGRDSVNVRWDKFRAWMRRRSS
jgi:1-acyl-sn-glycerol-3-phosphate acyltransferase